MSQDRRGGSPWATALLTGLALIAFAGNSLLNRAALADGAIDWASFTAIRIVSGAALLALLLGVRHGRAVLPQRGNAAMALALFAYAALFSWAYIALSAATGALVLFALVQITMQGIGVARGHYPAALQWLGLALAFAGMVWLLLPGLEQPPVWPALAMAGAGVAWGVYSWLGRSAGDPSLATARNFLLAVPLAGLLLVAAWPAEAPQGDGIALAIVSGGITSGLGYMLWYRVLPRLSVTTAAVGQLSVPALAALGGVLLLGEALSGRVLVASLLIFAGIALTIRRGR